MRRFWLANGGAASFEYAVLIAAIGIGALSMVFLRN